MLAVSFLAIQPKPIAANIIFSQALVVDHGLTVKSRTFLLVSFQSRQDKQNENGPISQDLPVLTFKYQMVLTVMDQDREPRRDKTRRDKTRREWSKYVRPPMPVFS